MVDNLLKKVKVIRKSKETFEIELFLMPNFDHNFIYKILKNGFEKNTVVLLAFQIRKK
jgi:hypothetical protein